jgi:hypothetical protein
MLRSMMVVALLVSLASLASPAAAFAQPKLCDDAPVGTVCKVQPKIVPKQKQRKKPEYDMSVMDLAAKNRKVMLMTFLERASEELERAALDRRSFIPELIKTVDSETL